MKYITRTIWLLSFISLLNDVATEMLTPVMPIYLKQIGFSIILIGVLEGIAEAVAGISKGYFGRLSDNTGRRKPFVQLGYLLSALSKPMLVAFATPVWVFLSRTLDKTGKGLRTGARDAMLSDEAAHSDKGKVFGFHRSMDTLGAVIGPTLALTYLYLYPENYRELFLISFFPGIATVLLTVFIKDKKREIPPVKKRAGFFTSFTYLKQGPKRYRVLVTGLLLFALFNSSDAFLILGLKQQGIDDVTVIGYYIFFNLVYALFAFPIGIIADKLGLLRTFVTGLLFFAIAYLLMAFGNSVLLLGMVFFFYGLYAAATEGISKAWISNMVNKDETATAIGAYAGLQSIAALLASSCAGLIWYYAGSTSIFILSGAVAVVCAVYFVVNRKVLDTTIPIAADNQ